MDDKKTIVQVDKTIVKVSGLKVKGLNIQQLEGILADKLKSIIRIIGVTGSSIDMDVYGVDEEAILQAEDSLIKAISLADGISISDMSSLSSVKKVQSVDIDNVSDYMKNGCRREGWMRT